VLGVGGNDGRDERCRPQRRDLVSIRHSAEDERARLFELCRFGIAHAAVRRLITAYCHGLTRLGEFC